MLLVVLVVVPLTLSHAHTHSHTSISESSPRSLSFVFLDGCVGLWEVRKGTRVYVEGRDRPTLSHLVLWEGSRSVEGRQIFQLGPVTLGTALFEITHCGILTDKSAEIEN